MKRTFFPNETTISFNVSNNPQSHPKMVTVRDKARHAHTRRGQLTGMLFDTQSNTFTIKILYC